MIAMCVIRQEPHYRRDAFVNGLRRAGYTLTDHGRPSGKEDLLIIWNRYGANGAMADRWEDAGGTVLVAENGYIGKDSNSHQLYALAVHGHNGSGRWPVGDEDRWTPLNIPLQPWVKRVEGYSLICGQRGIGTKLMASPPDWHKKAYHSLSGRQLNDLRIRLHPGNNAPTISLDQDLSGASDCVIWSSSSGVRALTLGIPVRYDAPHWVCSGAAEKLTWSGEAKLPVGDDDTRLAALKRMAWAQWRIAELETGEPFVRLREFILSGG